jgi:hypothetical protein
MRLRQSFIENVSRVNSFLSLWSIPLAAMMYWTIRAGV